MKSLIVSKDPIDLITNIFKSSFSKINLTYVQTIQEAKMLLIEQGAYFPIIINAETNIDAQDLVEMISDEIGECPIIILGNNSKLKHDDLKNNLFVTRFPIPIDPILFKSYMEKLFEEKIEEESKGEVIDKSPESFISLRLKSFYLYNSLPYDVYMQITERQYMKVLSKDMAYNEGTIQKLKERNVRYLYLEKDNHITFLEKSMHTVQKTVINKNSNSLEHDIKKLVDAFNLFQEYIVNIGVSDDLNKFFETIIIFHSSIVERIETPQIIHNYFNQADIDIPEQAVFKSLLCCFMARKLQWGSNLTKEKFVFSAILHDAYIKKLDLVLIIDLMTNRKLSEADYKNVLEHSLYAEKVADQFTFIPEVSYIIRQHHQIPDTRGFPNQMSPNKINQVSALFIIVNHYVSEMLSKGNDTKNIKELLKDMNKTYDKITAFKPVYSTFMKIFKAL